MLGVLLYQYNVFKGDMLGLHVSFSLIIRITISPENQIISINLYAAIIC